MTEFQEQIIVRLDERWQNVVRKVISDCKNPPDGNPPPDESEVNDAAFAIYRAIQDCEYLDEKEKSSFFEDRFFEALNEFPAFAGILWLTTQFPDGRKGDIVSDPRRFLNHIRERVRDGLSPNEVLSENSLWLQRIAASGDTDFFAKALPRALREMIDRPEKFSRGIKQWIHRAWIPLALWKEASKVDGSPQKAHTLLNRAGKLLPSGAVQLDWNQFYPAWSKFKPTDSRSRTAK